MSEQKRGLGRGLAALIPGGGQVGPEETLELPVAAISPNPNQPRTVIVQEKIDELADSIGKVGVLQPIIVRPHSDGYQIIAGERRWRAAKAAGLEKVPVRIMNSDDGESLELALIENLQRSDLNAMEEAHGFRRLLTGHQMTQAELASKVSKSRSAIANTLRLLDLPDEVQEMLANDTLTPGHARAVLSIPEEEKRLRLAKKIVDEGLSVREAEQLARLFAAGQSADRAARPVSPKSYKIVARKLRRLLATNVRVRQTANKGKIEIDFMGEEELERIYRMLTEGPDENEVM
ncbi:MAG: ParB/RepB/Spo0J family partition protein [Coriobacteriia bacterium]|nr:ParB/RepB/Spo0J family partition protein [Coriobacteriia bacterium]